MIFLIRKKIQYALCYVYGIGLTRSGIVCKDAGIDLDQRTHELSEEELNKLVDSISKLGYIVEGDLRREVFANIKRLQAIKSYRGMRHYKRLPSRGQRTKTNARTLRGKRNLAIANKK